MNNPERKRIGNWIQTYSGKPFYPLTPYPEDIDIGDVAHSLSMQCRYAGHCKWFYSIAEHSVHVSHAVPPKMAMWGLLHDAAEAYISDIPRPVKRMLHDVKVIEGGIMRAVCEKFGLSMEEPHEVTQADYGICRDERAVLMAPMDTSHVSWHHGSDAKLDWEELPPAVGAKIECWSPELAKRKFVERFSYLSQVEK